MFSLSSNIKSVNKTLILNICSVILLQGISFFTGPIFTRILGAEQYGLYSVFNAWVSVLACVMGFNVSSALVTARYQFKNSYELFKSSVLLFGTIICGAVAVLCICFIRPIAALTGYSYGMVILLLLMAFAKFVIKFAQDSWTYEKKAQMNFFVSAAVSIMSVSLSLLMVFSMSPEIRYLGKIYGYAIPHIIAAVIIWFVIYLKKPAGMNLDYWKYSLTIGFPVIFHSLSQNILTQSDRLMMEYMNITNSSIGIYSVFYGLTAVLGIILSSLNTSWCPFYYDDLENKKWEVLDRKCKNYIELFVVLTCGFILLSREAGYLYAGKEYYEGINVIPILVLAIFFTFMYQFPVNFEFFHKKTNIIAVGTMGAAVSNIILNAIMIPRYGMYGAAMATAISYAFLFLAHCTKSLARRLAPVIIILATL
jgi:O-antigen/teichoic acid export membrane protein